MNIDKDELLAKVKEALEAEVERITYKTWLENLQIKSIDDNKIILIAESDKHKYNIMRRFYHLLQTAFKYISDETYEIEIIVEPESVLNREEVQEEIDYSLNPNYTFENFVLGDNNKFAYNAAYSISETLSKEYNPLYIYGKKGTGKTHLIQAIGNKILENNPNYKSLYITTEHLLNDFLNALNKGQLDLFKDRYKNIDVLLIDDIQFIAVDKFAQEDFLDIFNMLYQNGKQIIISSDRMPKDMECLEERLKGRFSMGIMADISMPDYETRLAIIKKKVQEEKIIIDDYILSLLASKIDSNIRELKGALNKMIAYSSLTHTPITIEIAEKAINDIILQKEKVITADYIQEMVSKYFNIDKKDLISAKKSNDIVFPRQISMYLCRTVAQMALPQIGKAFGNRDHTTVMHAVNKIEKEMIEKPNTKLIVESLKNVILDKNN